jgi:hypothetical protein
MPNQEPQITYGERPGADYRGALVYRQERGFKLITMTVSIRTLDEQSRVVSRSLDIDILEEAEHIPSGSQSLTAVDVYHFPVTDGTKIELTISSQTGERQAHYTVHSTGVEEDSPSPLWLDIVKSSESIKEHDVQSYRGPDYSVDR